jgi:hypothetical protein
MGINKTVKAPEEDYALMDWVHRSSNGEAVTYPEVLKERLLQAEGWKDMEPLQSPAIPSLPYPIESLPCILRDPILEMQRIVQAPLPLIAASVVASANLAVQPHADIATVDGRLIPISLFFLTEALSGERKSTVDHFSLTSHREHDDEVRSQALADRERLIAAAVVWERRKKDFERRQNRQQSSGRAPKPEEERAAFLEEVGPPPPPWQGMPVRIVRDPTLEGLEKQFAVSPSLGLFSDEAATFFGGYSMSADNAFRTMAGLSALWDGKGVNRARAADGMTSHPGKRLSMHLMVQPVVLNEYIAGNEGLKGQGLLPRCLITRASSTIGTRKLVREEVQKTRAVLLFHETIKKILSVPLPLKTESAYQLQPRMLPLSSGAEELYIDFYNEIESRQGRGGDLAEITGTASKTPEQALRLAATFELCGNFTASCISPESFEAGREVARYYLNEALRLDQYGHRNFDLDCAEKILQWVKEKRIREFKIGQLLQFGPTVARRSSLATKRYVGILCSHGYLRARPMAERSNQILYEVHPRFLTE